MHDKNSLDFEEKGKIENILKDSLDSIPSPTLMAIEVVEFSREGYKIRKVFA